MHGSLRPIGGAGDGYDVVTEKPRRLRWLPALLLIAAVLAGAWYVFQGRKAATPEAGSAAVAGAAKAQPAPRVTVIVPGRQTVENTVRVTGSIAARRTSPIGVPGDGGMVTAVLAQEGQFVRRGQVLVRIDRAVQLQQLNQMSAGIRQAQADLALSQAELDRAQQLVGRGFISKADIDRRTATRDSNRARVDVARAQLGEMQARVARLDVRAPDNGLILTRSVEPGQVVGGGSAALFTMAQDGAMEMRAVVAEQELAQVTLGQSVTVTPVGATQSYTGRVWLKDPIIDPSSRQGIVRIALPGSRELRPGSFARATITAGAANLPVLPQSAVQSDDRGNFVLVIGPDNKVQRRAIEVGQVSGGGLVVASGLVGNERVVASAAAFLNPGETVDPVIQRAR